MAPLRVDEGEVLGLLAQATDLPTLPPVAARVVEAAAGSEATVREVAALIEKDVALSAKVLQVINSPFYGFSRGITSVGEAVSLMGFRQVGNLAMGLAVMSSLPRVREAGFSYEGFWHRSMSNAVACVMTTARVHPGASHGIFTTALLQNVGTYLLVRYLPLLYGYALSVADRQGAPVARAEREVLGTDHAEVGAHLIGKWGLPPAIRIPIRYHHYPDVDEALDAEAQDAGFGTLVNLLNVSSLMAGLVLDGNKELRPVLLARASSLLLMDSGPVEDVLSALPEEISRAELLFRPDRGEEAAGPPPAARGDSLDACPQCGSTEGTRYCGQCGTPKRRDESPGTGRPHKVLVAEDSAATRTAIRAMLRRMGYEVSAAINGEDAVRLARQERPDLILMDIMMPVMDGIQALKVIRGDTALRTTPVVMLTSTTDVRMVTEAIECGANDYIAKPFSVTLLTERVERYVHARGGANRSANR